MNDEKNLTVQNIREKRFFSNIDLSLADYVCANDPEDPVLYLAAALASHMVLRGHSCCDMDRICGIFYSPDESEEGLQIPPYSEFEKALNRASENGMAAIVPEQEPGARPLILDQSRRLYLNRYYNYELSLAEKLAERSKLTRNGDLNWDAALPKLPDGKLAGLPDGRLAGLSKRFAGSKDLDYQQAAVFLAHARNFTIITGGPGTGKTTVLTALLAWEIKANPEIRIELCAPTGKAQKRMMESIADELDNKLLCCSESESDPDPTEMKLRQLQQHCQTVDSLLKPIYHTPNYRRNRDNPIPADLVVVDEASMSSLSQLCRLFDALETKTRVILIGDKNQLSSVEAGAVLGDLIASGTINEMPKALAEQFQQQTGWDFPEVTELSEESRPLSGCIVELNYNHRSDQAPTVCDISSRMCCLDETSTKAEELTEEIMGPDRKDFAFRDFSSSRRGLADAVSKFLAPAKEMVQEVKKGSEGLKEAFERLESFKILCAVRRGFYGVENINKLALKCLGMRSQYNVGMPLIVLENTPSLNLFNGDIGLVWQKENDDGTKEMLVAFPPDQDGPSEFRSVRLSEMPPHEAVFAMTVHKSQGSGFNQVMVVLPPKDVPVLTRELLYTAITRTKRHVLLCSGKDILLKSLQTPTVRYSGLPDRLKEKIRS